MCRSRKLQISAHTSRPIRMPFWAPIWQTGAMFYTGQGNYNFITITTDLDSSFIFTPDGSKHYIGEFFSQSCTATNATCPSSLGSASSAYPATDASGWVGYGNGVRDSSGNSYTFSGTNNTTETIADATGQNTITKTSTGWTDTMNRSLPGSLSGPGFLPFPADSAPVSTSLVPGLSVNVDSNCPSSASGERKWTVPASQSYAGGSNGTVSYYFCFRTYDYQTAFNVAGLYAATSASACSGDEASSTSPSGRGQAQLLASIVLPDGLSYTFDYDQYLSLKSLGLPSGGSIAYVWQNVPFQTCKNNTPLSRALETRTVNPGDQQPSSTTTYQWPTNNPTSADWSPTFPLYSIATDSAGNDTEYTIGGPDDANNGFYTNVVTKEVLYQGCGPHNPRCTSPGSLLRSSSYTLLPATSGGAALGTGGNPLTGTQSTMRSAIETHLGASSSEVISKQVNTYVPGYSTCTFHIYPAIYPGQPESGVNVAATSSAPSIASANVNNCYTLNQVASTAHYDNGIAGSGSVGSLLKTESTSWAWQSSSTVLAANQLNLVNQKSVSDSRGNWAAESDICYDAAGDQTSIQRFLAQPSSRSCATPPSGSLVTRTAYNTQGVGYKHHRPYRATSRRSLISPATVPFLRLSHSRMGQTMPTSMTATPGK